MTPKDFEKIIVNSDSSRGETMDIHYRNGKIISGFVQAINYNFTSPYVNLCKSEVPRGESSDHTVQFDQIVKLVIKPFGKDSITYE